MNDTMQPPYLALLDNRPIALNGIGAMQPPTLRRIKELGETDYRLYLSLLASEAPDLCRALRLPCDTLTAFEALTARPALREDTVQMLSFFLCGQVRWSARGECYVVTEQGKPTGTISRGNFDSLRQCLLAANHIPSAARRDQCRGALARSIFEKLQKGRTAARQRDKQVSLADLISALCAQHNSYNLLNVWDLTVFQLYDQLARQSVKTQLDAACLRWAAYGTDPFDFTLWYQPMTFSD